jgi:aryl-alcohol dehydrogenase-like predicted oxidoreductase
MGMTIPHQKLVLGTVQLGMPYGINNTHGQPSNADALAILQTAHAAGIRTLDTADAYGTATAIIGEFHATCSEPFRIITKFHAADNVALAEKARETCSLLRVQRLACYQYHRFSDIQAFAAVQDDLQCLKEQGLVERVGASVYTNEELQAASAMPFVDVIQLPFNLLDNHRLRGEFMREAKEQGKELHVRSVFLQGLLFKPLSEIPKGLQPLVPALERLHSIAKEYNLDMAALALNYVLHHPLVDAVLVGVERVEQLEQLLSSVLLPSDALFLTLHDATTAIEAITLTEPHVLKLLNPVHWQHLKD